MSESHRDNLIAAAKAYLKNPDDSHCEAALAYYAAVRMKEREQMHCREQEQRIWKKCQDSPTACRGCGEEMDDERDLAEGWHECCL